MRVFSFGQESTRYCNYSKDKFGNQLTFIIPCWFTDSDIEWINNRLYNMDLLDYSSYICGEEDYDEFSDLDYFLYSCLAAEKSYNRLTGKEWQAQQARSILPNAIKTEIIMTGFVKDWIGGYDKNNKPYGFFPLRVSKAAHPQMRELACPLLDELKIKMPEIFGNINYE